MPEAEDQMPEIPPFMKRGKQAEPEPEAMTEATLTPQTVLADIERIKAEISDEEGEIVRLRLSIAQKQKSVADLVKVAIKLTRGMVK